MSRIVLQPKISCVGFDFDLLGFPFSKKYSPSRKYYSDQGRPLAVSDAVDLEEKIFIRFVIAGGVGVGCTGLTILGEAFDATFEMSIRATADIPGVGGDYFDLAVQNIRLEPSFFGIPEDDEPVPLRVAELRMIADGDLSVEDALYGYNEEFFQKRLSALLSEIDCVVMVNYRRRSMRAILRNNKRIIASLYWDTSIAITLG